MPSRFVVAAILLFWLGTTSIVAYRELRPRYFADVPATVSIELSDEATPALPVQWNIYRGSQIIGTLTTRMAHVPEDDSFKFISKYSNLKLDFGSGISFEIPTAETVVRVTRDGQLREQNMNGKLEVKLAALTLAQASTTVTGTVQGKQLIGHCVLKSSIANIDRALEPVPVPEGQVLNPLMPVNRLKDVSPGKKWTIRLIDPLNDSLKLLMMELAKNQKSALLPTQTGAESPELVAEVLSEAVLVDRAANLGGPVKCWVIEYRSEQAMARTFVSVTDGRVIRQEARRDDEMLRFERRD